MEANILLVEIDCFVMAFRLTVIPFKPTKLPKTFRILSNYLGNLRSESIPAFLPLV